MGTPGSAVIRDTGRFGLTSTGRLALFNSAGACPSCCGDEPTCPCPDGASRPSCCCAPPTIIDPDTGMSAPNPDYCGDDPDQCFCEPPPDNDCCSPGVCWFEDGTIWTLETVLEAANFVFECNPIDEFCQGPAVAGDWQGFGPTLNATSMATTQKTLSGCAGLDSGATTDPEDNHIAFSIDCQGDSNDGCVDGGDWFRLAKGDVLLSAGQLDLSVQIRSCPCPPSEPLGTLMQAESISVGGCSGGGATVTAIWEDESSVEGPHFGTRYTATFTVNGNGQFCPPENALL